MSSQLSQPDYLAALEYAQQKTGQQLVGCFVSELFHAINAKLAEAAKRPIAELADLPACLDTPEFRATFTEYIQWRRREKKPKWSAAQIRRNFAKWSAWGSADTVIALNQAMDAGWQGVFAPKGNDKPSNRQSTNRQPRYQGDGRF